MKIEQAVELDKALAAVTSRLVTRFGHQIDRAAVEETVRHCAGRFAQARFDTFAPLFVERYSIECLVALTAGTSHADGRATGYASRGTISRSDC